MMKKFLGVICFIYASLILFVWIKGDLNNYIAPNMQIYIKVSVLFLNKVNYRFKISDLILLLPLILIMFAGDGNLSSDIAKVKATSKNRTKIDTTDTTKDDNIIESVPTPTDNDKKDPIDTPIDNDKKDKITDFYFDIEESTYSYLADYITYMTGARKYVGKTIKAKGFAVDYSEYLTDDYFAFGRYMITCCAADAEFTGFMVKYPSDKIEYGKWYEVEGYLEIGKDSEGYDVMTINPTKVKEVSQGNSNNNVYSCDSYGKGACEKLQQYDLEY